MKQTEHKENKHQQGISKETQQTAAWKTIKQTSKQENNTNPESWHVKGTKAKVSDVITLLCWTQIFNLNLIVFLSTHQWASFLHRAASAHSDTYCNCHHSKATAQITAHVSDKSQDLTEPQCVMLCRRTAFQATLLRLGWSFRVTQIKNKSKWMENSFGIKAEQL